MAVRLPNRDSLYIVLNGKGGNHRLRLANYYGLEPISFNLWKQLKSKVKINHEMETKSYTHKRKSQPKNTISIK